MAVMEVRGQKSKSAGVVIALILLALIPHWRTIFWGELPLPEGYLALLAPELKPQLRQTPWNALWWDSVGQFWAWRTEAMRQMYQGRIPLWTNRVGCGFPFLANPQTQSLYPPAFLGSWMLTQTSFFSVPRPAPPIPIRSAKLMAWLAFFHTLLALVGAYLLIRSYGISRLPSLIGASAYGLGSFQIAWALLPTLPATAAWLPLTIWLLRKLMAATDSGDFKAASKFGIGFSFSSAMMLLAGHGQIAIYSLLALILFAFLELIPMDRKVKFFALLAIALPLAFSFLLAAAQLLPTIELTPFTHRHGAPTWEGYKAFAQRGLTVVDWATMALPFLFGNPIDGSYFGKESFADYCAYAGFGILVFAILGVLRLGGSLALPTPRKRLHISTPAPFHAFSLFLLGALLASGSTFNLPLYFLLPGFSQLGTPSRAIFLCQLALGLMAAWALDGTWSTGHGTRKKQEQSVATAILLTASMLVLAVGYVGWWLNANLPNFSWNEWIALLTEQNIGIVAGFLAVVIFALSQSQVPNPKSRFLRYGIAVLLVGELLWFAGQQVPTARPLMVQKALQTSEQNLSKLLKPIHSPKFRAPIRLLPIGGDWSLARYPNSLLPPNSILLLIWVQVSDARNYDSLLLRHHKAVMGLFSNGNPCPLENGNLILMPMGQTSLQDAKELAQILGADLVVKAFGERLEIADAVSASPKSPRLDKVSRAFVPMKVRYVGSADEAISQLLSCPEDTTLLVASPQKHWTEVGDFASVTLDKDVFVRVVVSGRRMNYGVRPIWLVLADTAYPGWRAFLREREGSWRNLTTAVANGAFRACHVPDVSTEVVWVYFPSSFAIGAFLSCVGVFFAVALLSWSLSPFAKSSRKSHN